MDRDARNMGVTKELKAGPPTVRLMEEGSGATTWAALEVRREGQITA